MTQPGTAAKTAPAKKAPKKRHYETDSRNFAIAAVTAGYALVGARRQAMHSHLVLFRFELESTAQLSEELGEVTFVDFLTAWKLGTPALPILDIRRLDHAMEVVNFHMKEARFLGQNLHA